MSIEDDEELLERTKGYELSRFPLGKCTRIPNFGKRALTFIRREVVPRI